MLGGRLADMRTVKRICSTLFTDIHFTALVKLAICGHTESHKASIFTACTHACTHTRMHTHMHKHTLTRTHKHTHTHTHTHLELSSVLKHGIIADVSHEQWQYHLSLLPDISTAVLQSSVEWSNDASHLRGG